MSKRVIRRKVKLEYEEEFDDGGSKRKEIEVENVDFEERSKSPEELTKIALRKLGEKDV